MSDNHDLDRMQNSTPDDNTKNRKRYDRPNLTVWGSVADLTRTGHLYSTLDLNGNRVAIVDVAGSMADDNLVFNDSPFPSRRHSNIFSGRTNGRHNKL